MSGATASARGLFRATGNKTKPVHQRQLDGTIHLVEGLEREEDDFYPTPPEPTRAFLHAEIGRLRQFSSIWEAASGDGAMVREMESLGLDVFASDLVDRGAGATIRNFYNFHTAPAPAIVTNPPFSECGWGNGKARWLKHALDVLDVEYMALLLNWTWPGAGGLAGFWAENPPARVYLMRWKIDFTGQGAPPMLNGWFVWDRQWQGETVLRMLDRKDARQSEMFPDSSGSSSRQTDSAGETPRSVSPATLSSEVSVGVADEVDGQNPHFFEGEEPEVASSPLSAVTGDEGGKQTGGNRVELKRVPLRPHCQNPNLCAGSGREHCHRCRKAMAESEAA